MVACNWEETSFFSDYSGFQKFTIVRFDPTGAPFGEFDNVGDETYGLEVSAGYQPNDQWMFSGSLGLLHTEFEQIGSPGVSDIFKLTSAPGSTLSLGVDNRPNNNLTISGRMRYTDGYFSDDDNTPENRVNSFALVDLSARYEFDNGATLYAFVDSVFDEITAVKIGQFGAYSVATVTTLVLSVSAMSTFSSKIRAATAMRWLLAGFRRKSRERELCVSAVLLPARWENRGDLSVKFPVYVAANVCGLASLRI